MSDAKKDDVILAPRHLFEVALLLAEHGHDSSFSEVCIITIFIMIYIYIYIYIVFTVWVKLLT